MVVTGSFGCNEKLGSAKLQFGNYWGVGGGAAEIGTEGPGVARRAAPCTTRWRQRLCNSARACR